MSFFEISMLICFGVSWPISIVKTYTSKQVTGKSPFFLIVVFLGYACGITHKLLFSLDWVIILYAVNALLVMGDFILYCHFVKKEQPKSSCGV